MRERRRRLIRKADRAASTETHDSLSMRGYCAGASDTLPRNKMISSIKIKGYRGFADFSMEGLGRINLLVGRNNSGKTSILEGLYLLSAGSSPLALWQTLARRGEQLLPAETAGPGQRGQAEIDVTHLFSGHEIKVGSELTIATKNEKPGRSLRYRIDTATDQELPQLFPLTADGGSILNKFVLRISGEPKFALPIIPLTDDGSIRAETFQRIANVRPPKVETGTTQFVTTESLSIGQLLQLWDPLILSPDEDRVVAALRVLDENIDRIAQVSVGPVFLPTGGATYPTRGGFAVRLKGTKKRIPIGSFGDGMWRMLALAVAISRARGNLLLIDEIDTGLHYSVMADMWKLINEAAKIFSVQVFATTHSYDCVHSIAKICDDTSEDNKITIQRIESSEQTAVAFTGSQIKIAAEREIEIR